VVALAAYLALAGLGCVALGIAWSAQTASVPRDGQAFSTLVVFAVLIGTLGTLGTGVLVATSPAARTVRPFAIATIAAAVVVAFGLTRPFVIETDAIDGRQVVMGADPAILIALLALAPVVPLAARLAERR
jgi:predicted acyltransferase